MNDWHGCYDSGWRGLIVDEAFAHPAKIAHGLAFRIYDHAIKQGWLKPGSTVLDPFGGIGGTALHAATAGIRWIGVELEPRFHALALQNFELWRREFGRWPEWVTPTMICGDSRRLGELVGQVGCVVSSPPFASSLAAGLADRPGLVWGNARYGQKDNRTEVPQDVYGQAPGQLGSMREGSVEAVISSPPYATGDSASAESIVGRSDKSAQWVKANCGSSCKEGYGRTDGQLSAMKEGDVSAIISSPPYAESIKGDHGETETAQESRDKRMTKGGSLGKSERHGGYGVADGQLGALKEGSVDSVISSPPYAESNQNRKDGFKGIDMDKLPPGSITAGSQSVHQEYGDSPGQLGSLKEGDVAGVISSPPFQNQTQANDPKYRSAGNGHGARPADYGQSDGQLGNSTGDTFWTAARQIVAECHRLLRPGGVAIWVVKDYVKNKQIVPFCDNWRRLCESVGFRTVCQHRAMLVKDLGEETNLFEAPKRRLKERKSFFRRLAEKKGSPRIDYEMVICMEK